MAGFKLWRADTGSEARAVTLEGNTEKAAADLFFKYYLRQEGKYEIFVKHPVSGSKSRFQGSVNGRGELTSCFRIGPG